MNPFGNSFNKPQINERNRAIPNPYGQPVMNFSPDITPTMQTNQGPTNTAIQQSRFLGIDRRFISSAPGIPSTSTSYNFDQEPYQRTSTPTQQQKMQPNPQGFFSQIQKEQQIAFRMINVSFDNQATEFHQQNHNRYNKMEPGLLSNPKKLAMMQKNDTKLAITASSKKSKKDVKEVSQVENLVYQFVGSVEQVLRWYNSIRQVNTSAIYEVHGILESKFTKPNNTIVLYIKQYDEATNIQGIYYAVDRPLMESLQLGSNIVCVGSMKGTKKMQIYNAWQENGQQADYKRISLLCQRAIQDIVLSSPEP